ncbi:MAG: MarR family transcriptional regulator [Dehalococcoidales bacterium]|nr:MarR family transcriptional regulator [Dehalococcoidales bacterium]
MKKESLINEIIKNQRLVNRHMDQYNPDIWMGLSLTIAQVKSLFFIFNEGTVNFRQLAAAMKVTPSNVTGIIDRLVEQELVSRTENPEDRRMLMLRLTEKGEVLISNLRERRFNQMSSVLSRMTESELEVVLKGVAVLAEVVEAEKRG